MLGEATNTSEVFSGTKAHLDIGRIYVANSGLAINNTVVTANATELNKLDGLTSSTAELNLLDGATVTTAEINLIDGNTARGTTAVANGDGFLHNDGGTMRMTNVSKIADLMAGTNISASSSVLSVANASASGKGVIEIATSAETRTGTDSARAVTPAGLQSRHGTGAFPELGQGSGFTQTIAHGLGTYVHVTVIDTSDGAVVYPLVKMTSANGGTVTMAFSAGASANAYRYMISLVD